MQVALAPLIGLDVVVATAVLGFVLVSGQLWRMQRQLGDFGLGTALAIVSIILAIPLFITFFREGVVLRVPTAILSTGLMLLAFLSVVAGLMLDTVTRGRREMKRLVYLQQRAPDEGRDR